MGNILPEELKVHEKETGDVHAQRAAEIRTKKTERMVLSRSCNWREGERKRLDQAKKVGRS